MTNGMVLVVVAIVFVALVVKRLPWRRWAKRWVGNRPDRAMVKVRVGNELVPCYGWLTYEGDEGATYGYQWAGLETYVCIPREYPVWWEEGHRVISVAEGSTEASPLLEDEGWRMDGSADLVAALVRAHVVTEGLKTYEASSLPLNLDLRKLALLAVGVAVVGFLAFNQGWFGLGVEAVAEGADAL